MKPLVILSILAGVLLTRLQSDPAGLVERLRSDSIAERVEAARQLRSLGPASVPALEKAARSSDSELSLRSRELLEEIGTPDRWIEALKSDDVPDNARLARRSLSRFYGEAVRSMLLEAAASEDPQQAIEAAHVLVEKGEGRLLFRARPEILARASAAFLREEDEGFHWVAGSVMLKLGALADPTESESAFARALRGVPPHRMSRPALRDLSRFAHELNLPFPRPVLRHYLANLRNDDTFANAYFCEWGLEGFRPEAVEELKRMLGDADRQARKKAFQTLLGWKVPDLPREHPDVIVEMVGKVQGAALLARALVTQDTVRWEPVVVRRAIGELSSDEIHFNACEATELLVRLGPPAIPSLLEALRSDDEQTVTCAAIALHFIGRPVEFAGSAFERVLRLAGRTGIHDEKECVVQALVSMPGLWPRVEKRLRASGGAGANRASALQAKLDACGAYPWLKGSIRCRTNRAHNRGIFITGTKTEMKHRATESTDGGPPDRQRFFSVFSVVNLRA